MPDIIHLTVSLSHIKPRIWRRLEVRDSITFYTLHEIIQEAVGWWNYHLFEFKLTEVNLGIPHDDYAELEIKDAKKFRLADFVFEGGEKFRYIYDFGDYWEHEIEIEKVAPAEKGVSYPRCTDGERNAPPEDCGGAGGYEDVMEAVRGKAGEMYDDIRNWLTDGYDPEYFNLDVVNRSMNYPKLDKNCPKWLMPRMAGIHPLEAEPFFEGLSLHQLYMLTYMPLDESAALRTRQDPDPEILRESPLFRIILDLLGRLAKAGSAKLTSKGNLPRKWVQELYNAGHVRDDYIDRFYPNIQSEDDATPVKLAKLVCEHAGMIKKRNGRMSLTTKCMRLLSRPSHHGKLFLILFEAFLLKHNWMLFDGYPLVQVGQHGAGFTLLLLKKYGDTSRATDFYAQKYFQAFPVFRSLHMYHGLSQLAMDEDRLSRCYAIRSFYRSLDYWGMVDMKEEKKAFSMEARKLERTRLLDYLFEG